MSFTIITKNGEKTFNKELINISSKEGLDYRLNLGFDYILAVQYDANTGKCYILNQYNCPELMFKNNPLPQKIEVEKFCKIMVKNSDEYIIVRVNDNVKTVKLAQDNFSEQDAKELYGNEVNVSSRLKIEKRKSEIEEARVSIIKQVQYEINNLKHKLSMNSKTGILLHIALFVASLVLAFGVSNYLTGLPLKDSVNIIQMPVNLKLLFVYAFIIYSIGLILKQGVFLFLQNTQTEVQSNNRAAESAMIILSSLFYTGIYIINLLYFLSPGTMPFFAIFISLFFIGGAVTIAVSCGYYKHNNIQIRKKLNRFEYREDFEHVLKEYQLWIERYINNLSPQKISKIKDGIFMLQLKSLGEILLGILTAPFLAYGVSNTLAMCFPEAAGWIRISGLRFSPVFLVLATFMIIFAFFAFVNAFFCNKKIQASNVLKNDGFSDYAQHGIEIYGLTGIKKLDTDMARSFAIGLSIIFIEFSMNISYFMQEIGGDLRGMFLSTIAALVPTALLIAETYMLSQTKFDIHANSGIIEKRDRE